MIQLQILLQEDTSDVLRCPLAHIDVVAVSICGELEDHFETINYQIRVLSDGEVSEAEIHEFSDLTIRLVGGDHEVDAPGVKGTHGGGHDTLINVNAAGKVLAGLLFIADSQVVESTLLILLLATPTLLKRVFLLPHVLAVEDAERTDLVVGQQVQHFKDVEEESVALDVLVEFEGTAIAPLVQPGHDVDRCRPPLEAADVLTDRNWLEEFQKAIDSHWRQLMNIKSNKIGCLYILFPINTNPPQPHNYPSLHNPYIDSPCRV